MCYYIFIWNVCPNSGGKFNFILQRIMEKRIDRKVEECFHLFNLFCLFQRNLNPHLGMFSTQSELLQTNINYIDHLLKESSQCRHTARLKRLFQVCYLQYTHLLCFLLLKRRKKTSTNPNKQKPHHIIICIWSIQYIHMCFTEIKTGCNFRLYLISRLSQFIPEKFMRWFWLEKSSFYSEWLVWGCVLDLCWTQGR